jgi:hypothetical protein
MSITSGITGGGSYSGSSTLRWNRGRLGIPVNYRGRNWNLVGFATNEQLIVALALLPLAGPIGSVARGLAIRGLHLATRPLFWAGVNVYEEAQDIRSWMRGDPMSWQLKIKLRPISKLGPLSIPAMYGIPAIPVPMPYLDFTKSPSSGVGGPGEIPNLHRPPPSIEETGKLISDPPMVGDVPSSPRTTSSSTTLSGKRRKPCPRGYRWNGRRCVRKG